MKLVRFTFWGFLPSVVLFLACGGKDSTGPTQTIINMSITPATLNFGNVDLGNAKDSTFIIQNQSSSNANLSGNLSVTGTNFSLTSTDVSFNLPPGQTRAFTVRFSPASIGTASGAIAVAHNANNQAGPGNVALSGNGEDRLSEIGTQIQSAWQAFEAKDYDSAETRFGNAINLASRSFRYDSLHAEAEGGRGWTRAYKRNFTGAKDDFTKALTHAQRQPRTDLNTKAGLALVYHALNEFPAAIQRALEVLNASQNYIFEHDNKVTHQRVRLVLAQSITLPVIFS
jgi:tetratricopeptide (TPR) repeat protein